MPHHVAQQDANVCVWYYCVFMCMSSASKRGVTWRFCAGQITGRQISALAGSTTTPHNRQCRRWRFSGLLLRFLLLPRDRCRRSSASLALASLLLLDLHHLCFLLFLRCSFLLFFFLLSLPCLCAALAAGDSDRLRLPWGKRSGDCDGCGCSAGRCCCCCC